MGEPSLPFRRLRSSWGEIKFSPRPALPQQGLQHSTFPGMTREALVGSAVGPRRCRRRRSPLLDLGKGGPKPLGTRARWLVSQRSPCRRKQHSPRVIRLARAKLGRTGGPAVMHLPFSTSSTDTH